MGEISPDLECHLPIWRIVTEGGQSLIEVEKWDLPSIREFNDFLDMREDHNKAYRAAQQKEK